MKVLLINSFHFRKGGSEAVYFGTAELLLKAGHEVVFLSFEDDQNITTDQHEYFVKKGNVFKKLISYFSNGDAAKMVEIISTKEKPDIAHAHLLWGGLTAAIIPVLHRHGIPLVHTAHDYRMVCPAYLLKDGKGHTCERCKGGHFYECALHNCSKGNTLESLIMTAEIYYRNWRWHPAKQMDGIIFVSNFSMKKHLEFDDGFLKSRRTVLYNCPGAQVIDFVDKTTNTYDSYYLFYGRLSIEKGVQTLLRAFKQLPMLKLKVVGTGLLENELKTFCLENKLKNVEFLGYKTGMELFNLVAKAKYVCVPSECFENNPMTIVEAYSLGTPVIGAAIGGISEVINDSVTGFTFESGNVDSLTSTIIKANNVSLEEYTNLKTNAFIFGNHNFSRDVHLKKLLDFYNEIIMSSHLLALHDACENNYICSDDLNGRN